MAGPGLGRALVAACVLCVLVCSRPARANKCDGLVTMSQIVGDSPDSCPSGDGMSDGLKLELGLEVLKGFATNTDAVLTALVGDDVDSKAGGVDSPDHPLAGDLTAAKCKGFLDADEAAAPLVMEKVLELQEVSATMDQARRVHKKKEGRGEQLRTKGFYMNHIAQLSRLQGRGAGLVDGALEALAQGEAQCSDCAALDEKDGVFGAATAFCVPHADSVASRLRDLRAGFSADLYREVRGHCQECCQASGPHDLCMFSESNSIKKLFGTEDVDYTYECGCAARTVGTPAPAACTPEMCTACDYAECYLGPSEVAGDNEALRAALAEHLQKFRVDIGAGFAKFHKKTSMEVTKIPTAGTVADVIRAICVRLDIHWSDCRFADLSVFEKRGIRRVKLSRTDPALGTVPAYGDTLFLEKNVEEFEAEMARQHEAEEAKKEELRQREEKRRAKQREDMAAAKARIAEERARKLEEERIEREKAEAAERERLAEEERIKREAEEKERLALEAAKAAEEDRVAREEKERQEALEAAKTAFRKKCQSARRRARYLTQDSREWFGTPIFCGGECPRGFSPAYYAVRRDAYGAGSWYSACWTGTKVLCERRYSTTDIEADCSAAEYRV